MKDTLLGIQRLSKSISPSIPHISIFIPLDGDERVNFINLYNKSNNLLSRDSEIRISKFNVDWKKYKRLGFKSVALYITHKGHIEYGLPFVVQAKFIIGDTFHIKPLLLLENYQKKSLLLHFNNLGLTLYLISAKDFKVIDTYIPMPNSKSLNWTEVITGEDLRFYMKYIKETIVKNIPDEITSISITGLDNKRLFVKNFWNFDNFETNLIFDEFDHSIPRGTIAEIQKALNDMIESEFKLNVDNFLSCKKSKDLTFDFNKISQMIRNNMITKLYISLEDVIFGTLCTDTGNATINQFQQDTKDKDILNCFMLLCLERNIEVSVIPKKFFPMGFSLFYR